MDEFIVDSGQASKIKKAADVIRNTELESEEVLEILRDWESRQCLTAKKIFATTAVLLAAAAFVDINYSELKFWTLSNPDQSGRLALVFLGLLLLSGAVYHIQREIDKKMRRWRQDNLMNRMAVIERHAENIHTLLASNFSQRIDLRKSEILTEKSDGSFNKIALGSKALSAYFFFVDEFSPKSRQRADIERYEYESLMGLALVGVFGLGLHFFLVPVADFLKIALCL